MEAYLVAVFFLWMLPQGLNVAVTFPPNQHSTNFRSNEITTPSEKNPDGLKGTNESLTNAPNVGHHGTVVDIQRTKKSEQNTDRVSVSSSSMYPQIIRTMRKAEEKQDSQATTNKDNTSIDITTEIEETASNLGNQSVDGSATLTSKSQAMPTASSLSVISELSTKTAASPMNTQASNTTTKIHTGPAVSPLLTLQSSSSTNRTQNTQPSSTPTHNPVITQRSSSSPTDQVPAESPEMPHNATPAATTLPPSIPLTNPTAHITSQASSEPAETITSTAAKVTTSTAVINTKGQSTPMAPTTKPIVAFTMAGKRAESLSPTHTAIKKPMRGNHGTVVAVLIGGTLVLMMVSIAVILVRKQRQRIVQLQNTSWAGPSPFMDGGFQSRLDNDDSSAVNLRGSNRVSFSGFLSQRLSKRMSLLQETDDQIYLDDVPVGLTFGRESVSDDVKPSNGTAAVDKEKTQTDETQHTGSSSPSLSIYPGTNATEPTNEQPPCSSSSPSTSASSGTTVPALADEQQPSAPLQVVDLKPDNAHHSSPPPPDSQITVAQSFLDVDLSPPPEQTSPPPPENTDLTSLPDAP